MGSTESVQAPAKCPLGVMDQPNSKKVALRNREFARLWPRREREGWRIVDEPSGNGKKSVKEPSTHPRSNGAEATWAAMWGVTLFNGEVLMVPNYYFHES